MEPIVIGLLGAVGAAAYNAWGFLQALQKTQHTKAIEVWDPLQTVITVCPTLVAAFLAGYNMTPDSVSDITSIVIAGFGLAAAQSKALKADGVKAFFRTK